MCECPSTQSTCLSQSPHIAQGQIHCRHAGVDTAAGRHPDGTVGTQRGAKEGAFCLWLLSYMVVSNVF